MGNKKKLLFQIIAIKWSILSLQEGQILSSSCKCSECTYNTTVSFSQIKIINPKNTDLGPILQITIFMILRAQMGLENKQSHLKIDLHKNTKAITSLSKLNLVDFTQEFPETKRMASYRKDS